MRKALYIGLLGLFGILGLSSCRKSTSITYRTMPKEYVLAWEEIYGHAYDSVPYPVVALDLYSKGLELDADHRMRGTGYNLYISDIFVPESQGEDTLRLVAGKYHSERTAQPFTFLPGKSWDGQPTGMYVLYVENGKLQTIQMLDSGYIVVKDTTSMFKDIEFTLYYKNSYGSRATYKPHFQGYLRPWEKR